MKNLRLQDEKGQLLVEMLIGITLFVMGIGAAVLLVSGGSGVSRDRADDVRARILAREGLHATRGIVVSEWASTTAGAYGLVVTSGVWAFSGASSTTPDGFTRQVTVTNVSSTVRDITSRVTWMAVGDRARAVQFQTRVADVATVVGAGGDTGGGGTSGDWSNPQTLGTVDLGAGIQPTDLDVVHKIVYMTSTASSDAKHDFWIVDATDSENPTVVSSLNTSDNGLVAVDAEGSYAYAVQDDDEDHLQIFDVSDINSPVLVASYGMPGNNDEEGLSVFYRDSKVYVGTEKDGDSQEFFVVDVTTPSSPSLLGSYEVDEDVYAIYVDENDRAYLALDDGNPELVVLDVSTPSSIIELDTFDANGGGENSRSIYVVGTTVYFGRKDNGHSDHHQLHVVDATTPTALAGLGSLSSDGDVNDFRVRDQYAFFATDDPNEEFQVWDISTPSSITFVSSLNFPQIATGIDYEDNIVYVSVKSNDGLRIITSQ